MHLHYTDITDPIDFVLKTVLKEAKREDRLTKQLFITHLSAYSNNPINLLINAPSGVGKNYVINIVSSLFPQSDILSLAGMTEKALFHRIGKLVIKNEQGDYESIDVKIDEIENEIKKKQFELSQFKDETIQQQGIESIINQFKEDKKNLLKDAKKLIDLSNKIIIF